jgi:hypothetical protein
LVDRLENEVDGGSETAGAISPLDFPACALRPSVLRFAVAMEEKLRARDSRYGHWRNTSDEFLFLRLVDELGELSRALMLGHSKVQVPGECADVGNMAMMLFDRALGCAPGDPRDVRDAGIDL